MRRLHAAGLLLLTVSVVFASWLRAPAQEQIRPEAAGLSRERLKHVDALLDDAVEKKQIAGGVLVVMRKGKIGHLKTAGMRDVEAKQAMTPDTIFRIASMTKPVTSVAAMILVDEGKLRVEDPVSKYIPEFKSPRVLAPAGDADDPNAEPAAVPAKTEMTVHHLLTHTSGLAYGFSNPRLAKLYEKADIPSGISQAEGTLAEHIRRLAALPLAHEPGDAFTYGLSSDVLGRVVEVASGQSLDAFFRERIFKPLGMHDTMFYVPAEKQSRLAALYALGADKALSRAPEEPVKGVLTFSAGYPYRGSRTYFSGGGGLVGTVPDYARFLQMLLNGGELDGVRILKAETVKRMTSDQLGKANVPQFMAGPHGDRFGYGFGVVTMPPKDKTAPAVGSFSWGGAFRTYFWVDPQNQMLLVLMTQVAPFDVGMGLEARKRVYEAME